MRGYFPSVKADDAGGLSPGKEDNADRRKIDRIYSLILEWFDYKYETGPAGG